MHSRLIVWMSEFLKNPPFSYFHSLSIFWQRVKTHIYTGAINGIVLLVPDSREYQAIIL